MRLLLMFLALGLCAVPVSAQNPDYVLTFSNSAGAPPFGQATISALVDFPNAAEGLSGWSVGCCQSGAAVTQIVDGAATDAVNPAFNSPAVTADGWTAGAIVDFSAMVNLAPQANAELYALTYDLEIGSGAATLNYCDTVGAPPVPTILSLTVGGNVIDIDPTLIAGTIPVAVNAPYELSLNTALAAPGQQAALSVALDCDTPVEGFSFGLTHDAAVVGLDSITPGALVAALNSGAGPDFFGVNVNAANGTGGTVGCAISLDPPFESIPAGTGQVIAIATYAIAGNAPDGTNTIVDFADTLGSPTVPILISVLGLPNSADTNAGTISISGQPTTTFRRGDVNNDGGVDIIDLVIGAQFLFGVGAPVSCEDAIDTDDNGTLEPIIDTIYLAAFLFQGGPTLGAPFPNCGSDGTPDSVECVSYTGPCP